jgi:hypothetical protein
MSVRLTVVDGTLLVQPLALEAFDESLLRFRLEERESRSRAKGRPALADLMALCDLTAEPSEEERAWVDDAPTGREQI